MRDIRGDLRDRLDRLGQRRKQYQRILDDTLTEENLVGQLLAIEEQNYERLQRHNRVSHGQSLQSEQELVSLNKFVTKTLSDREIWDINKLKVAAEGVNLDIEKSASLGRSLQAALMGLKQRNIVFSLGNGKWRQAR